MRCTYILLDILLVAGGFDFHSAERAAKTVPREECHGFAHVPRHETPLKNHTKTASYAGYVALYFYDSYEIALIVAIALAKN